MTTASLHHAVTGVGQPLVLVHGFTGSSLDWTDVLPALATSHTVVTLDHRGHGASPHTGGEETYSFDALVGDLAALVDRLGFERFDLLGHSMGGVVAMRYALARPERVRSLILMDTGGRPAAGMPDVMRVGIDLVRAQGPAALFPLFAAASGEGPRADELRGRVRTKLTQMDRAAFTALGEELLTYPSLLDALGGIDCPVTVLVGELDHALRPGADDLVAAIPGARLEVIAGAGHSPQDDDPAAWLAALDRHFARR
jgi:pimeloyl-ACP methyl ester carboxylesterase